VTNLLRGALILGILFAGTAARAEYLVYGYYQPVQVQTVRVNVNQGPSTNYSGYNINYGPATNYGGNNINMSYATNYGGVNQNYAPTTNHGGTNYNYDSRTTNKGGTNYTAQPVQVYTVAPTYYAAPAYYSYGGYGTIRIRGR